MIVYGASGHAKVVVDILESCGNKVDYLVDDNPKINEFLDYRVWRDIGVYDEAIIAIGSCQARKAVVDRIRVKRYVTAIHPSATISHRASIGAGTVVMQGAVIQSSAEIGRHCIINTGAIVDHDCCLGDFVHVSPQAAVLGGVRVGECTWVGAGAVVKQNVSIGAGCIIGAGAVVLKDVPDGSVVAGVPAKEISKQIYLCLAHMSDEGLEQKYIKEAFDSNWVAPLGPNVSGFEADLKKFVNEGGVNKEVVALSAGTAAVHLALIACGVGPGDEVIVQSFTFCASSNPVRYLGAVPVFVDSEPRTWNMDPNLLEEAIRDRIAVTGKKPAAIIPVALYGMPYDVGRIMEIADRYQIPVIEDAAEGFGSKYDGRVLGTFGKFGVLSFNGNKMITTSGGGALICEDSALKDKVMWAATQAREAYPYYQHEEIGYNYRMSNICAGIGRGQMAVAQAHIDHHKHVQTMYEKLLSDVSGIKVHSQPDDVRYNSNFWLCTIVLDPSLKVVGQDNAYKEVISGAVGGAAGVTHAVANAVTDCQPNENVEALRLYLQHKKIEARPVWKPMHKQPVYRGYPAYVNGVSEAVFRTGMCLPAGPWVTDEDVGYIVASIKEAIRL